MDVPTLSTFLRLILIVTTVWNTGETGDINTLDWKPLQQEIKENL